MIYDTIKTIRKMTENTNDMNNSTRQIPKITC